MKTKTLRCLVAGGASLAVATAGITLLSTSSQAAPAATPAPSAAVAALPSATQVFQDFNKSTLIQNSSGTSYASTLLSEGTKTAYLWEFATDISAAQDAYQRSHSPADLKLANDLVTKFIKANGTTWSKGNNWNDDIGWIINVVLRGYQTSGNQDWLKMAETQWNAVYDRGWSSNGGGGIWENMKTKNEKGHLSNDPFIWTGVQLYQITGNKTYLTKAQQIYDWSRKTFLGADGHLNHAINFPDGQNGKVTNTKAEKAYNVGIFVQGASSLYRVTGDQKYVNDGLLAIDYLAKETPVKTAQYWGFRGIGEFVTDTGTMDRYAKWMQDNAVAAWNSRNKANLTGGDWTKKTADKGLNPFSLIGMVGLFQVLPDPNAKALAGTYTITSASSKLPISLKGDATANDTPIVQANSATTSTWTLVPDSNGYYKIKNTLTGKLLNVAKDSAATGGKLVQWPDGNTFQGNDKWLPIRNADGTYSFYNRNSQLALDSTASTASGTQLQQWSQNGAIGQKFTLTKK